MRKRMKPIVNRLLIISGNTIAVTKKIYLLFLHEGQAPSQFLGQPMIVGIEKRDEFAARLVDAAIAGSRWSAIMFESNQTHHRKGGHYRLSRERLIRRRAVIDNDCLCGQKRLRGNRFQSSNERMAGIEKGDHDGHRHQSSIR
jgi:hypothetical protein